MCSWPPFPWPEGRRFGAVLHTSLFYLMVIPNGDRPKWGCKQLPSFYICEAFCRVAVPHKLFNQRPTDVCFVPLFLLQIRSQFPQVAQQSQKVNTSMTVINIATLLLLGKAPLAHPPAMPETQRLPRASPVSVWTLAHPIGAGHRFCVCPAHHNIPWFRANHPHGDVPPSTEQRNYL